MQEVDVVLVRELMTREVLTVVPRTPVNEVVRTMAERRITALPVVDRSGRVVGVVSEADVLRRLAVPDPRARLRPASSPPPLPHTVDEVMTREVGTTVETADVVDVAAEMARHGWKSVPVVDDAGRLVGLLSRSEVLAAFTTPDDVIRADLERELAGIGHPEWALTVEEGVVTVRGVDGPDDARLARDVAATARGVRGVVIRGSVR
ncbi:MAG: CBS domain-containing protein [Dermatophilaceae bacterium]